LSGSRAPSGGPQRDAMQLWLDRPPPTSTLKLRVKFVDVAGSTSKLLLELRRAVVDDRADAVVVGVSVAGDGPFAQVAEVAQVPVLLTLPAPEPMSGRSGGWLFALAPAPSTIASAIAADVVDRGIVAPMLLASDESPGANLERAAFVAELGRRGIDAPTTVTVGGTDGPVRIRIASQVAKSAVLAGPAASYGDLIRPIAPTPAADVARIYLSYLTETADLSNLREASAYVTWPAALRHDPAAGAGDRPVSIDSLIYDWNRDGRAAKADYRSVELDDETLRDGLQGPSVRNPPTEIKKRLLHLMDQLGIDSADIGLPGASERARTEIVALAKETTTLKRLRPNMALRTHPADVRGGIEAARQSGVAIEACAFIGSSPIRRFAEDWSIDTMLRNVEESVTALAKAGLPVMFVTEDTTRADAETLSRLYETAIGCGANRICASDTVGHATPEGVRNLLTFLRK